MEIINLGKPYDRLSYLKDICIAFCHQQKNCSSCPLRYAVCRKVKKYTLITEWKEEDLREAVRIIGDSNL